jgi:nucleotide-binding universal stress UspA family protein
VYEHIVVPFDGSADAHRAVMAGTDLSRLFGAELVVVTASPVDNSGSLETLKASAMAKSDRNATVWIEPEPSMPTAVSMVTNFRPKSLICMVSDGRAGLRRAFAGSPVERILRQTDAPMLVLGPLWDGSSLTNVRNLVVCVDGSATAEAAIPLAANWASALRLDVTMVHVRTDRSALPVDLDRLAYPLAWSADKVQTLAVDHGDPVAGLLEVLEDIPASIVVVATKSLTGLDRLVHHSFTGDLSRRCPVPMLVRHGPLPTVTPAWLTG